MHGVRSTLDTSNNQRIDGFAFGERIRTAADADDNRTAELYVGWDGGTFLTLVVYQKRPISRPRLLKSYDTINPPPVLTDIDDVGRTDEILVR